MFDRLGILNAYLTYDIFNLSGLSGRNPTVSQGASVQACPIQYLGHTSTKNCMLFI